MNQGFTKYVCDCCDASEVMKDSYDLPDGWQHLWVTKKVTEQRSNRYESWEFAKQATICRADVCKDCFDSIEGKVPVEQHGALKRFLISIFLRKTKK